MSMNAVVVPPAIKMTSAPALDETLVTAGTSKILQLSGEYPLNTRRFTGMELKVSYWYQTERIQKKFCNFQPPWTANKGLEYD